MLFALFCLILFSPCLVSFIGSELLEASQPDESECSLWKLPRWRGNKAALPSLTAEEASLPNDFVIRSFAKGISQRRVVVQDLVEGVRLTIAQVRVAVLAAAKAARAVCQGIQENNAQLLRRLADEARIAVARQVLRDSRRARVAGAQYARACSGLRWAESIDQRQSQAAA